MISEWLRIAEIRFCWKGFFFVGLVTNTSGMLVKLPRTLPVCVVGDLATVDLEKIVSRLVPGYTKAVEACEACVNDFA